jgi:Asp-tRNA(Asn)/Glu-tRNA(Gln) amidotransferase A subunit family amidase
VQASARPSYQDRGYLAAVEESPSPDDLTVGVIEESFGGPCRSAVVDETRDAIDRLVDTGVTTRSVSIPHYEYGVPVKNGLSYPANAAVWRDCALPYRRGERVRSTGDHRAELPHRIASSGADLNEDLQAKILAGALMMTDRSGRDYVRAHAGRDRLRSEFKSALSEVDVLLTPTMPDVAPPIKENPPDYDYGWNTRHPNIVQLPALTLPSGTVDDLPVDLQVIGSLDDDATVLGAASTIQSVLA